MMLAVTKMSPLRVATISFSYNSNYDDLSSDSVKLIIFILIMLVVVMVVLVVRDSNSYNVF